MKNIFSYSLAIFLFLLPAFAQAQQSQVIVPAKVITVQNLEGVEIIPGTGVTGINQNLTVRLSDKSYDGQIIELQNDYHAVEEGDKIFVSITEYDDGSAIYGFKDIDRRGALWVFAALFALAVLIFSGKQGIRSLLSLAGSILVIFFVLVPALVNGYPPVLTSIVIAATILFLAIFVTHGMNKGSLVAFLGTLTAVILTGLLAHIGVEVASLTGLATEEALYLNMTTGGSLNFSGLLLGGIMIGVLGVLDDIAITQTAVVNELYRSAPHLTAKEVYMKALHVGREHVGALVNTLALAYTGASLPLLLLFSVAGSQGVTPLNQEIFATEVIRTVVGSIGLILTVPITTLLAVHLLKGYKGELHAHVHAH